MSHNPLELIENLKAEVSAAKIQYHQVTFPMTHVGDGVFKFANGFEGRFAEIGAGYLSERVPVAYAWFTAKARKEAWDDIERACKEHGGSLRGSYVAAVYNGHIVGVMSHYNPIPHLELIDSLDKASLLDNLDSYWLNETAMTVDIRVSGPSDDVLVFLRIINGHSGHQAISYHMVIRADGYEWVDKKIDRARRRHLSKVGLLLEALDGALEIITDLKATERLKVMSAKAAIDIMMDKNPELTIRQERLLALLEEMKELETAMDVVTTLGTYASTVGYRAAVTKLLNPVIDLALGH